MECLETWSECSLQLFCGLKAVKPKKESGNTVFWFFPFFWSAVNLAGMVPPKSQFRTRFRKFEANPEDWDHKKAMLNGRSHLKVPERLFWGKKFRFAQFGSKCQTKTIFITEKFWIFIIRSQIMKNSLFQDLWRPFWHFLAIIWPIVIKGAHSK